MLLSISTEANVKTTLKHKLYVQNSFATLYSLYSMFPFKIFQDKQLLAFVHALKPFNP